MGALLSTVCRLPLQQARTPFCRQTATTVESVRVNVKSRLDRSIGANILDQGKGAAGFAFSVDRLLLLIKERTARCSDWSIGRWLVSCPLYLDSGSASSSSAHEQQPMSEYITICWLKHGVRKIITQRTLN
jgi:hypothetical protein